MSESRILFCKVETKNDSSSFYDMDAYDQAYLMKWIKRNLYPIKGINKDRSSRQIKQCFEHDTGRYVGNNAFKEAMLLSGYCPVNTSDSNWIYHIGESSPAFKRKYGTYDKQGRCNIVITKKDLSKVKELIDYAAETAGRLSEIM